jgi:glycosyltransferase involved in cell wall biosynthesis
MRITVSSKEEAHSNEALLTPRPKILFLAYYFPPRNSSGSIRTWNIAQYLARLGWDVTVVTPDPSVWEKVEDTEKVMMELEIAGIGRILTGHQWRSLLPNHLKCWNEGFGWVAGGVCRTIARRLSIDRHIGWVKNAERACARLNPKDVDIILASGAPFIAFKLAKRLADRLRRPYVLDYRDPWTGNPHNVRPARPGTIQEEANLLKGCAAVTIVSPSWGITLEQTHGVGSKLHVVSNGYNPEEVAAVKPHHFGHCAFVYTGIFYPPKRVITPFLMALKLLKESLNESNRVWRFHYYGIDENHVREEADLLGLNSHVVLHGKVAQQEAVSAVKGANLAVVITSIHEEGTLEDKGIVTGKIFESIGVGTPVLLIAPKGSDATTTTETTGLVRSFTGADIQGMASFLESIVRGQVPHPNNVDVFSWTNIAKKLDMVLREAISSRAHI